jgi:hypothetical protein
VDALQICVGLLALLRYNDNLVEISGIGYILVFLHRT